MTAVDLHDETSCPAYPDATRRRAVLGMAVAVGAVCAGCASSKSSTAATGSPTSSAGSAGSGTDAAASPSPGSSSASATDSSSSAGATGPTASAGSSGGAAPLTATSAVPVGGGAVLAQQAIVVTQPAAGTFKAFTAVCTHMGCTVSSVENGLIVCPCHGSKFHIADGSVAGGPASQPLAPVAITVSGGEITKA